MSPSQTLKNSLLDDQFKVELENVVFQNSPPKDGKHTGRDKNIEKKGFEFNMIGMKDQSSDEDYKSAKSGKNNGNSKTKKNNFVKEDSVDSETEE